jgi:hypothetical protein
LKTKRKVPSERKICKRVQVRSATFIVCQEGVFFQLRTPLVMPSLLRFRSDIGQRWRLRTLPAISSLALGRHGNKVMPLLTLITLWRRMLHYMLHVHALLALQHTAITLWF